MAEPRAVGHRGHKVNAPHATAMWSWCPGADARITFFLAKHWILLAYASGYHRGYAPDGVTIDDIAPTAPSRLHEPVRKTPNRLILIDQSLAAS